MDLAQKLVSGGLWYCQWRAMVQSPLGYSTVTGGVWFCQYWDILSIMGYGTVTTGQLSILGYGTTILCNGIVSGELRYCHCWL